MEEKLLKLREFLKREGYDGLQTFNCRNTVGDPMCEIYNKDGIKVDFCGYYNYLEIFGLNDDELESLSDVLGIAV